MTTIDSDRRILDIAQAIGSGIAADLATVREAVPAATHYELYCALTALRDVVDARLAELEPAARAERISELGGVN